MRKVKQYCPLHVCLGTKGLADLFGYLRDLRGLFTARAAIYIFLAALLAPVGQAQQTSSGSTPTPATNVTSTSDRVVLKVGSVQVTQADFETMVSDLEAQQGPADLTRKAIGDNYASLLMLSQKAVANHLESSPEVIRQLALDRTQILSNAEFARLKQQAKPTPEEISAYYNAHLADYDTVTIRRLFIWKKPEGSKDAAGVNPQDAKPLADAIRQALATGKDPGKLIHDNTSVVLDVQPLPFQRGGELPSKMEEAAFALKPGEWIVFEDSSSQLVLLQGVSRGRKDLKDVSSQIEKKLQAQKLKDELADVKKNAGIWMDEQYFGPPQKPVASTQPKSSAQEKQ